MKLKRLTVLIAAVASLVAIFFVFNSQTKPVSIETQLKELQKDYSGIIQEKDSKYGKLVFYSIEKDEMNGVGLALFEKKNDHWVYSKGTSHLIEPGTGTTDQLVINNDTKIIYGYINNKNIYNTKEIDISELEEGIFKITNSVIKYAFVNPEFKANPEFKF